MSEIGHVEEFEGRSFRFLTGYGVYETGDTTIVSVPNWESAKKEVHSRQFGNTTVLLPEIITVAGQNLTYAPDYRTDVERELDAFQKFTATQPEATFVVGSPHYVDGMAKPFNAAFVMKNGQLLAVHHKRIGSAGESNYLQMDVIQPLVTIGKSGFVICSDLQGVGATEQDKLSGWTIPSADKQADWHRVWNKDFIGPDVEQLLVISCWGIGMSPFAKPKTPEAINEYYRIALRNEAHWAFNINPNLKKVIVCDRAPTAASFMPDRLASSPMSLIAAR